MVVSIYFLFAHSEEMFYTTYTPSPHPFIHVSPPKSNTNLYEPRAYKQDFMLFVYKEEGTTCFENCLNSLISNCLKQAKYHKHRRMSCTFLP